MLTVPTAALFDGAVTATATDLLARAVSASFRVSVRPPALVLTARSRRRRHRRRDAHGRRRRARHSEDRSDLDLGPRGLERERRGRADDPDHRGPDRRGRHRHRDRRLRAVGHGDVPGRRRRAAELTTPPTFAAAAAPGTALGSVWNIADGVYAGGVAPFVTERRFLRDGVPIGAFGAATAYTVVAADQGRTITAQVRRTDSSSSRRRC